MYLELKCATDVHDKYYLRKANARKLTHMLIHNLSLKKITGRNYVTSLMSLACSCPSTNIVIIN